MRLTFALGCSIAIIFIIYNLICYKNKTSVYMLHEKYAILNENYYKVQLIIGLCNSFLLLTFYLVWYIFSKNASLFVIFTPIIFWGLNFTLEIYSRKKDFIIIKEKA